MNDRTESNAPLVLAKTGWVYAGGQVETIDGKQFHGRANLCRMLDPGGASQPLSGDHGAWRHDVGHQLHRHT